MSDWSSFEKDKLITESWRKYLSEVETVGGSHIQGLIGYGKKPEEEPEPEPDKEMGPPWYGVVLTDEGTLVAVEGEKPVEGAEGATPTEPTPTTSPTGTPTGTTTTTRLQEFFVEDDIEDPAPSPEGAEKPEEETDELDKEDKKRLLQSKAKEWENEGKIVKLLGPISINEFPIVEKGKRFLSKQAHIKDLFKKEFQDFFKKREEIAIEYGKHKPQLDEREGEPGSFDHEKTLAAVKKAEKSQGEFQKEVDLDKALMSVEGFIAAAEANAGGWVFEDHRTPYVEKPPPEMQKQFIHSGALNSMLSQIQSVLDPKTDARATKLKETAKKLGGEDADPNAYRIPFDAGGLKKALQVVLGDAIGAETDIGGQKGIEYAKGPAGGDRHELEAERVKQGLAKEPKSGPVYDILKRDGYINEQSLAEAAGYATHLSKIDLANAIKDHVTYTKDVPEGDVRIEELKGWGRPRRKGEKIQDLDAHLIADLVLTQLEGYDGAYFKRTDWSPRVHRDTSENKERTQIARWQALAGIKKEVI